MPDIPAFDEYVRSLGRLTAHIDPTAASPAAADIKEAATSLAALSEITEGTLTAWAADHPSWVNVLGLAVGLSQEKLKNNPQASLRHDRMGHSRTYPASRPGQDAGARPPYAESTGSGSGLVLRGGQAYPIRWSRPGVDGGTMFTTPSGQVMTFARGQVWVVLAAAQAAAAR